MMRGTLLPGQREVHFKAQNGPRRRKLLDQIVAAGVRADIYLAKFVAAEQELARAACLRRLVADLLNSSAQRLVMDTREARDERDMRTLQAALGAHPSKTQLTYEHVDSAHELLIGIPDSRGWAYGAGGDWRRRATPAIRSVIDCSEP
jgi:hypothetical protein